jgi:hypothetical protein
VTVDDQYHVITPLEEAWVDSPKEVRAVIARYMATDLSSLARVTVIRLPRGEGAQTGQPLSAADFWPPP